MLRSRKVRELTSRQGLLPSAKIAVLAALPLVALVRCNCEDVTFSPAAEYTPDAVLDFGAVAVNTESTQYVKVLSSGTSALKILSANIMGDESKFKFVVADQLLMGLTPNRTSSIAVTYRPCPGAWTTVTVNGQQVDQLKEDFDYKMCGGAADSAQLITVEDMTKKGGHTITLSGQPVQPPNVEIACQNGVPACNAMMPMVAHCVSMVFDRVTAGDTPCDLVVEVQNKLRTDMMTMRDLPVGELHIEGIDISVQELQSGETKTGAEAGFTVLDMNNNVLALDPSHPFVVPAPSASSTCGSDPKTGVCASGQFKIRFAGTLTGTWFGADSRGMTGVRLYTNDPNNKITKFNISGIGSSPDMQYFPGQLNFGPVPQNTTKTLTTTISNAGDAVLRISSIGFMTDTTGARFTYDTDKGTPPFMLAQNEHAAIHVHYRPTTSGQDSDTLLIGNNDLKTMNVVKIPVFGGAVPRVRVDPTDTLVFPLPGPPPSPPRMGEVTLSNVGYGDLHVLRLTITGPGNDLMHSSADDFTIMGCASNPCDRTDLLCPPSLPTCMANNSRETLTILYQNNDISTTDLAELHIRTDDPADMDHVLVLSAQDMPCFYPTPVITVVTPRPCKGMPVHVSGASSTAGGGTTVTGYTWSFLFAPAATPTFMPMMATTPDSEFTPTDSGTYIISLDVTNDCGRHSQGQATETINIADMCN